MNIPLLTYPRGGDGSLSTLVKPVSHSQKKTSHSLPPPRGGGRITPNFGHFSYKRLKKGSKNFPGAFGAWFLRTLPPGGSPAQNQSLTFKKPVTHPPPGGGVRAGLSNGMVVNYTMFTFILYTIYCTLHILLYTSVTGRVHFIPASLYFPQRGGTLGRSASGGRPAPAR